MNEFNEFGEGLLASLILISIEFLIFVFEKVNDVLPSITAILPKSDASNQFLLNFSALIGVFILLTIIQSLFVGVAKSKPFGFGFLFGDGIFLFVFYIYVLNVIPSVVYGMAISFLIVLACLIIRLHREKTPRYDQWNRYP
jgi:hypothetical protein